MRLVMSGAWYAPTGSETVHDWVRVGMAGMPGRAHCGQATSEDGTAWLGQGSRSNEV